MFKQISVSTLIAVGLVLAAQVRAEVLPNNGDSWVRENNPTTVYERDLVSVWNSLEGDRRYGVLSFDLTSLTEPVTEVSLSLWSQTFSFSDDREPLAQTAIAIDPSGIDPDRATWAEVVAAATLHTFGNLGTLEVGAPEFEPEINGVYLESVGTTADAAFVEGIRIGSGTLMIVMIADEGATNYKGSWGDVEFGGQDAILNTNVDVSDGKGPEPTTVAASADVWIRSIASDSTFEGDDVAVRGDTGDTRYGIIEFDLSGVQTTDTVTSAMLNLTSSENFTAELTQVAYRIDTNGGTAAGAMTWNAYQAEHEGSEAWAFESLGRETAGGPLNNGDQRTTLGSAADLAEIQTVVNRGGLLTIAFKPASVASDVNWDDDDTGNGPGIRAVLTVETEPTPEFDPQFRLVYDGGANEIRFGWESEGGMLYNLRSETGLLPFPATWSIYPGLENIAADPSGTNTETIAIPFDTRRFFALEAFPAPPTTVFEENFDGVTAPNLPGSWTTGANPADTGTTAWELGSPSNVGPTAANSAPHCVGTNLSADYGFDTEIWLRSRSIDLTAVSSATLTFRQFTEIEEDFDFGKVSVLDAADDSELAVIEGVVDGIASSWTTFSSAVPAEAIGKNVKIEFRFTADDVGNFSGWYIDDVAVTAPPN